MLRDAPLDPPRPFLLAGFDILTGNKREKSDETFPLFIEVDTLDRAQNRERVVDEP